MAINKSEMSTEEYQQHKENLRQKAFEAELNRLRKHKKTQKRLVIFSLLFSTVMFILFLLTWLFPTNTSEFTDTETIILYDTIYSKPDTVFIEKIESKDQIQNFFTVQIGAYSKQEMPAFLSTDLDFPLIEYQHNNLNCFAFGKFTNVEQAKEAQDFLQKIGFSTAIIVQISNSKRIALIK